MCQDVLRRLAVAFTTYNVREWNGWKMSKRETSPAIDLGKELTIPLRDFH